jgi:hypothetical protein
MKNYLIISNCPYARHGISFVGLFSTLKKVFRIFHNYCNEINIEFYDIIVESLGIGNIPDCLSYELYIKTNDGIVYSGMYAVEFELDYRGLSKRFSHDRKLMKYC